jgi:hypothetical protein
MKQINKKKMVYIFIIGLILIFIISLFSQSLFNNEQNEMGYSIPIYNKDDIKIGIYELKSIPGGSHRSPVPHFKLEDIELALNNTSNSIQFSSYFKLDSHDSDFSIEFYDNGDNRLNEEDYFIFHNYTNIPTIYILFLPMRFIVETNLVLYP